ncbi:hypothetical protein BD413DRAFT_181452 [Trametes elegans]|nr:hypothetical protein BD413DRAFT_181452 [Trametes elegans]
MAVSIADRAAATAYDTLVIASTIVRTLRARKETLSLDTYPNLTTLLLRDGTTYFLALLIINVGQGFNFLTSFASRLTSVLISRFLLNLREVSERSDSSNRSEATGSGAISSRFLSFGTSTSVMMNELESPFYSYSDSDTAASWAGDDYKKDYVNLSFSSGTVTDSRTAADIELDDML